MGQPQDWTDLDAQVLEQIRIEQTYLLPDRRREIAAKSGISYGTYRRIEEGTTRPTSNHINALCKVYGKTIAEFYAAATSLPVTADSVYRGKGRGVASSDDS